MRIKNQHPVLGTKKNVEKFLWWPLSIANETRWLKTTTIQYEYLEYGAHITEDFVEKYYKWKPIKFID